MTTRLLDVLARSVNSYFFLSPLSLHRLLVDPISMCANLQRYINGIQHCLGRLIVFPLPAPEIPNITRNVSKNRFTFTAASTT
ncbi:hypothetical protein N3K66_005311 [Trichothecium roseum]|uniref:Uncharacterized protein n=1 Tax=Trichothecium roseum TaxID=47278 RepID=A0ACC0V044_9HYPO|nr:hypothetical protein N3K66_005311 [Trichothecium roseum]